MIAGLLPSAQSFGQSMDKLQKKISESVRRFIRLVETWRRRARSRRELMARTDPELRDLGITRHDVESLYGPAEAMLSERTRGDAEKTWSSLP